MGEGRLEQKWIQGGDNSAPKVPKSSWPEPAKPAAPQPAAPEKPPETASPAAPPSVVFPSLGRSQGAEFRNGPYGIPASEVPPSPTSPLPKIQSGDPFRNGPHGIAPSEDTTSGEPQAENTYMTGMPHPESFTSSPTPKQGVVFPTDNSYVETQAPVQEEPKPQPEKPEKSGWLRRLFGR